MTTSNVEHPRSAEHPRVVSRAEWLAARKALLAKEKELTRYRDAANAERRRLPMVRIDKEYIFDGPDDKVRLLDVFEGRRQLIVYHLFHAGRVARSERLPSRWRQDVSYLLDLRSRNRSGGRHVQLP